MKQLIFTILFPLIFQNLSLAEDYFSPQELSFNLTPPSKISSEYKPEYDPLLDKFYPIGWSREGNFAFITEPADEACGCYFFNIKVIDKTGKELWLWEFENTDNDEGSVSEVWNNNQKMLVEKLKEFGIKQEKTFALQKSQEITIANKTFKLIYKNEEAMNDFYGVEALKKSELSKQSSDTTEIIFSKSYDEFPPLEEKFLGTISNPQNQILAIIIQEWRGYEGPPNVIKFVLVPVN